MNNELTFVTDSLFENVTFDKDAECWAFSFSSKIYVSSSGFMRFLEKNKIVFVSLDNGLKL